MIWFSVKNKNKIIHYLARTYMYRMWEQIKWFRKVQKQIIWFVAKSPWILNSRPQMMNFQNWFKIVENWDKLKLKFNWKYLFYIIYIWYTYYIYIDSNPKKKIYQNMFLNIWKTPINATTNSIWSKYHQTDKLYPLNTYF